METAAQDAVWWRQSFPMLHLGQQGIDYVKSMQIF